VRVNPGRDGLLKGEGDETDNKKRDVFESV
jgi:hypothetical protein